MVLHKQKGLVHLKINNDETFKKKENMKNSKLTKYVFVFQDQFDDEIESKIYDCWSKRDAKNIAANLLGNLSHNDIVKIKTKKQF